MITEEDTKFNDPRFSICFVQLGVNLTYKVRLATNEDPALFGLDPCTRKEEKCKNIVSHI